MGIVNSIDFVVVANGVKRNNNKIIEETEEALPDCKVAYAY